MSLTIEIYHSEDGKCRIELGGRLDTHTAPDFDARMETLDPAVHPLQVVDLSALGYVSSAGVRSLFKARKAANQAGGQLLLLNPQPQVRRVFDIIKALPSASVFASEAEMDRYLDAMLKSGSSDSE